MLRGNMGVLLMPQLEIFSALDDLPLFQPAHIQHIAVLSPDGRGVPQFLLGRILQAGMVGPGVFAEAACDHHFFLQPFFLDLRSVLLALDPFLFLAVPRNIFRDLLIVPAEPDGFLPVFHQKSCDLSVVPQGEDPDKFIVV